MPGTVMALYPHTLTCTLIPLNIYPRYLFIYPGIPVYIYPSLIQQRPTGRAITLEVADSNLRGELQRDLQGSPPEGIRVPPAGIFIPLPPLPLTPTPLPLPLHPGFFTLSITLTPLPLPLTHTPSPLPLTHYPLLLTLALIPWVTPFTLYPLTFTFTLTPNVIPLYPLPLITLTPYTLPLLPRGSQDQQVCLLFSLYFVAPITRNGATLD